MEARGHAYEVAWWEFMSEACQWEFMPEACQWSMPCSNQPILDSTSVLRILFVRARFCVYAYD